jgi:hypothetical protein
VVWEGLNLQAKLGKKKIFFQENTEKFRVFNASSPS